MKKYFPFVLIVFLMSCTGSRQKAQLMVYNATIYTVDSSFSTAESMVIDDGKIMAIGTRAAMEEQFDTDEKLDAGGKFIYPGFIDAHAHFIGYGNSLQRVNLV